MYKRNLKNAALFMCMLIVLWPIASGIVFAQDAEITKVETFGSGGIKGIRAIDDTTRVDVHVSAPEEETLADNRVKSLDDLTLKFPCTKSTDEPGEFVCSYESPQYTMAGDIFKTKVQLANKLGVLTGPVWPAVIVVDNLAPTGFFSVKVAKNEIIAEFNVDDEACAASGCAGKCSGIDKVEFKVGDSIVGIYDVAGTNNCSVDKGNATLEIPVAGTETVSLCMVVSDVVGQSFETCKQVLIDNSPPVVENVILWKGNAPLYYTKGEEMSAVTVIVNITEDQELEKNITLDLSDLNMLPAFKKAYESLSVTCSGKIMFTDTHVCTVSGIILNIGAESKVVQIGIKAADKFGNEIDETRTISIGVDKTAPVVSNIYTLLSDPVKGDFLLRPEDNTIVVEIMETESGFNQGQIGLNMQSMDLGEKRGPNRCEAEAGMWKCYWEHFSIATKKSKYDVSVIGFSMDDAGNMIEGPGAAVFRFDGEAPEKTEYNYTAVGEFYVPYPTYAYSGSVVELRMWFDDDTPITAIANFSDLVEDGPDNVPGVCDKSTNLTKGQWECVWTELGPIVDGPNNIKIPYAVTDVVGNTYSDDDVEIFIYAIGTEIPEYWEMKQKNVSPTKGLDRMSMTLRPMFSSHQVLLYSDNKRVKPLTIEFDPNLCEGVPEHNGMDVDYVNVDDYGKRLINFVGYAITEAPDRTKEEWRDILTIQYVAGDAPPEKISVPVKAKKKPKKAEEEEEEEKTVERVLEGLEFVCPITIIGIMDKTILQPETINFTLSVGLYNNKLGSIFGNLEDEIKAEEDWVFGEYFTVLAWLDTIFKIGKEICTVLDIVFKFFGLVAVAKDALRIGCVASKGAPPVEAVVCNAEQKLGSVTKTGREWLPGFFTSLYFWCGILFTCNPTSLPDDLAGRQWPTKEEGEKDIEKFLGKKQCPKDNAWCDIQYFWYQMNNRVWFESIGAAGIELDSNLALFAPASYSPWQSMFVSVISGCIPGIIHNLYKYREIKCKRLLCLKYEVPYGTMDLATCDASYDLDVCRYWLGQVFAIIPWLDYWNQIMDLFKNIFEHPIVTLAGYAIDIPCHVACSCTDPKYEKKAMCLKHPEALKSIPGCAVCHGMEWFAQTTQIANDIKSQVTKWTDGTLFSSPECDKLEKLEGKELLGWF